MAMKFGKTTHINPVNPNRR